MTLLSTKTSLSGEQFDAMLEEDYKDGKEIVLPKGTVFRGRVEKVLPTKRLSKSGTLYLSFDNVVTPTGKQIPTSLGLCGTANLTFDGGLSDCQNYGKALIKNFNNTGNIIKKSTEWGLETGEKFWNGYPKYVLAPAGAIAGTLGGTVYLVGDSIIDIFRKGNDVIINQGDIFNVVLTKPLDVPLN